MSKKKDRDEPLHPDDPAKENTGDEALRGSSGEEAAHGGAPAHGGGSEKSDGAKQTPDGAGAEDKSTPDEVIAGLESQLKAASDRYLRLMAEFDNYKKRTIREYEQMVECANEKLMLELVAVRETFELALKHGENGTDYAQFFEGVKLIFAKFDGVLGANGLAPFAAPGEPFDPQMHDALLKVPNDEIPEDHIADIHEKGYKLKDRIIKHARVIVSAGKPQQAPCKDNDNK